jgi:hypothetical protein
MDFFLINWEKANDPCPSGWRLPILNELPSLVEDVSKIATVINGQNGRLFGNGCKTIFLPAAGMLFDPIYHVYDDMSGYWSSTRYYILRFIGANTIAIAAMPADEGESVRCVKE